MNQSLPSLIWKTSLPMVGAILALLSYDLLESTLLALSGEQLLTAVGFTLPLTTAMSAIAIALSIRSNNLVIKSACVNKEKLATTVVTTIILSLLIVLAFSLVSYFSTDYLLNFMGNKGWAASLPFEEKSRLLSQQESYINVRYVSWIFLAIIWQINSILRALGQTVLASTLMMTWLAFKAVLAIILLSPTSSLYTTAFDGLISLHLLSDSIMAIVSIVFLFKRANLPKPSLKHIKSSCLRPKKDTLIIILQQLITPISMALLTLIAARIDYSYVAAFAFILRMESLFLLIPMVLTTSMPAIVGSNYWSGQNERVKHAYIFTFIGIILFQLVVAAILYFCSPLLSEFLCPQNTVANHITRYFTWVSWGYIAMGCIMVYQSCLNAKGKTIQALSLGLSHRIIILLPLAYIGGEHVLNSSYYQGMLYGHVINASTSVNDLFYQFILLGHLLSGLLVIGLLVKNRTFNFLENKASDKSLLVLNKTLNKTTD